MGEVADTLTKKKKKGRPSFIEVQKRALKQQQLLQQKKDAPKEELRSGFKNPNSGSRSNRRKYYPNEASDEDDDDDDYYYDDKKRRKNQRLLHGFNSNDRLRSSNVKSNGCDFDDNASIRRRKIGGTGSDDKKIDDSKDELRSGFKNPNSGSRSNRRKYNLNEASEEDDDDDDDKRRRKKQRLLHGLNSNDRLRSSNVKSDGCDFDDNASIRRRIIGATGSDDKLQKASKGTDILQRSLVESGPFTPLPDKKLLLFIVDRLQKKDTYGVYSDPVDPEELPDYHDIITNPMDFSTLRKKLESGAYTSLEQFEQDVFLICTNAMEYNSADTVYFRQARAMLEMAKKDFENLRQESDEEEEEEPVTLSQQPTTGIKKQPEPSSVDTAHILGGDYSRLCGAYNLRRTPPCRFPQAETSDRIIHHNSENQNGFSIDWEKEFPPSVVKAVEKNGMKNVENRRDTYNHDSDSTSLQEASIFTTFDDDLKQLTPVGLRNEYGYAMSLARFAAKLGPVAWRFASKRTETSLPNGIGFGFGENQEAPPQQQFSNDLASDFDDHHLHSSRIIMSQTTSVSSKEADRLLNQESESNGLVRALTGFNNSQNQMVETALSRQGLLLPPNRKQEFTRFRPDLNVKLVSPNSPSL